MSTCFIEIRPKYLKKDSKLQNYTGYVGRSRDVMRDRDGETVFQTTQALFLYLKVCLFF